jgi:hypothetical protein
VRYRKRRTLLRRDAASWTSTAIEDAIDNLKKWRYSLGPSPLQKPRFAVVEYRFVISAAPKSKYELDVVFTHQPGGSFHKCHMTVEVLALSDLLLGTGATE